MAIGEYCSLLPLLPSVSRFWTPRKCTSGLSVSARPSHAEPPPSPCAQPGETHRKGRADVISPSYFFIRPKRNKLHMRLQTPGFLWSSWPGLPAASCSLWLWFPSLSWVPPAPPERRPAVSSGCLSPARGCLRPPAADCKNHVIYLLFITAFCCIEKQLRALRPRYSR